MKKILSLLLVGLASADTITVYIGTGADGIYQTELDLESGKMTGTKLAHAQVGSGFLAMPPKRDLLYATAKLASGQGGVTAYRVTPQGLSKLGETHCKGGGLCHVSLDATNQVLLGANYGGGSVASFRLDSSGAPVGVISENWHQGSSVNKARQNKPHAHSFYAGPDNRFAYAPDLGIDKVVIYKLDQKSGAVEEVGFATVKPGSGPRHMKFGKDGKQAYVLNELTLTVTVFDRDPATGKLSSKQVISVLPEGGDGKEMSCSEVRISKDGRYAYTANRDLTEQKRDSVTVLAIGEGGKLSWVQTIGAEVWIPRNINLDPSGACLLVAGQKSNEVTSFKVDAKSGELTFTGHRVTVPKAMCIEFSK